MLFVLFYYYYFILFFLEKCGFNIHTSILSIILFLRGVWYIGMGNINKESISILISHVMESIF